MSIDIIITIIIIIIIKESDFKLILKIADCCCKEAEDYGGSLHTHCSQCEKGKGKAFTEMYSWPLKLTPLILHTLINSLWLSKLDIVRSMQKKAIHFYLFILFINSDFILVGVKVNLDLIPGTRNTPWMGCESITGHNVLYTLIHTLVAS